MNSKKQIQSKLNEFLQRRPEISFAYIFGSFTQSENYHDIDIAVFLNENFDKNDLKKFPYGYESSIAAALTNLLHTDKIDIVVLNTAPPLITNRIINTGKLLFDKNKFNRIAFENKSRKIFIDNENFRKIRTYYLLNKLNRYA